MGKGRAQNRTPEIPLSEVLIRLARGEAVGDIARSLGRRPFEVAGAVEDHARSLGSSGATETAVVRADGASRGNPGHAGIGWTIESGDRTLLDGHRYIGTATNNVAEYEAVLTALEKALDLGITSVRVELDSELVVRQINGEYRVRDAKLIERHARLRALAGRFTDCRFVRVPRAANSRADELANRAIDEAEEPKQMEEGNRK